LESQARKPESHQRESEGCLKKKGMSEKKKEPKVHREGFTRKISEAVDRFCSSASSKKKIFKKKEKGFKEEGE